MNQNLNLTAVLVALVALGLSAVFAINSAAAKHVIEETDTAPAVIDPVGNSRDETNYQDWLRAAHAQIAAQGRDEVSASF